MRLSRLLLWTGAVLVSAGLTVLVLGLPWWQRLGVDARCGPASAGRLFYAPDATTLVGYCDAAGQYVPLGAPLSYESIEERLRPPLTTACMTGEIRRGPAMEEIQLCADHHWYSVQLSGTDPHWETLYLGCWADKDDAQCQSLAVYMSTQVVGGALPLAPE